MDNLAGKISELLESPEGMESIRSLAGTLLGGADLSGLGIPSSEDPPSVDDDGPDSGAMPSPDDLQTMMKIGKTLSKLNSQEDDDRTRLLLALRPHLNEERQGRVDTAVKLLKLVGLLPLLTESGLF